MLGSRAEARLSSFYELFLKKIVWSEKCSVSFCKSSDAINRLAVARNVFTETLLMRLSRQR